MASKANIIVAREKVPDSELESVQMIPPEQVCVVYLGGNGTVVRRRSDGTMSTERENANGNSRYIIREIIEPIFATEMDVDIPVYSVGYDFDDMDTTGTITLSGDNKRHSVKTAMDAKNSGYKNYLVVDNHNIRRVLKNDIMPYLSENGHSIDVDEIEHRSRFLKIIIDGDKTTEFNFKKELYNVLLDLKYSDSEIDLITANFDRLIKYEHIEHIDELFHDILLPRISENGARLPLNDVLRNIRKITFVAHCYGAFVAKKLQEKMKSEMPKLGYSDSEIRAVLNQMLVVAHAPSCRLDNQTNGFISFMSASDNTALVPVNWLSRHITENISQDSREMVHNSLKNHEHPWFPRSDDIAAPIAFLPRRYGNMVIVPQSFEWVIDNGMIGPDDNEHNNTSYDSRQNGETKSGYILNRFAKNVIVNGIKNSLAQADGFIPLPDVSELLFAYDSPQNKQIFNELQKNGLSLVRDAYQSATNLLQERSKTRPKNIQKNTNSPQM